MYDALFSTYILVIVNINIYVMSGAFAILRITVTIRSRWLLLLYSNCYLSMYE